MKRLEFAIAWRYLRSRRGSRLLSFITVIAVGGVTVGVSALIIIIGVMNGLQHDMREKILVGSPDIRITSLGAEQRLDDWERILSDVRQVPGVVAAAPYVATGALIGRGDITAGRFAYVIGIPENSPDTVTAIHEHVTEGQFSFRARMEGHAGLILGDELASRLQVFVGDTVSLLSFGSQRVNPVLGPEIVPFRAEVTGVFHSGMFDYDNQFVYTELDAARRMAALGSAITGVEVRTSDKWRAPLVARDIEKKLERDAVLVEDWQRQNSALYSALKLEKLAMSVIVFLIVLVAAFNIVSVLTMLVRDKTREIGILRAMGMTAANVRHIFRLQGVFIGIVGTSLGLLVGLSVSIAIGHYKLIPLDPATYFIDYLPVRTEPLDVILIAAGSLLIAWLATLSPSAQASRLYPLEAIRDE